MFSQIGNMLAQICQLLAVDSNNFPQNESIIISDTSNEGSFLIHYFLNLCQKQSRPLCFVGLSQSFHHYNTVAQKLGTNLLSARDQNKNLDFVEGLKLLSGCVGLPSDANTDARVFSELLSGNVHPFHDLVIQSVENITNCSTQQTLPILSLGPVVIIDDLSVLEAAGVPSQTIISLISRIQATLLSREDKGSLVVFMNVNKEDEDQQLRSHMLHQSTLSFEVSPLSTGYCKDVHGQMKVQWQDSFTTPRKRSIKNTQFKLTDKSIDFFASGMSSAVL